MRFRKKEKNKSKVSWKEYKRNLEKQETAEPFNEYQRVLHSMTMKESDFKDVFDSKGYAALEGNISIFDQTNLDYFNYEKELTLGESND